MTHLTRDELERWWTSGDPADRARILGHLAQCDECIVLYASVMDQGPADVPASTPHAAAVVRGRRTIAAFRLPFLRHESSAPAWGLAVGMVVLIVAAAAILVPRQRDRTDDPGEVVIRGTRIALQAPIGAVAAPVEFTWSSPIEAARFRIEIADQLGKTVASAIVDEPRFRVSDEIKGRLQPGLEYRWQVVALDADGQPLMRSDVRTFSVPNR